MKIGIFSDTYTPDINGVVSSIVTLQKELEKNGHEVYVVTNHKAFLTTLWEGNVLRLPGLELKWLYGYKLSTPYHFSAKEEIRKLNLDVIHVHTEFGVGIFARLVAKSLNIPVVSTYHTMYEDYTHYINRFDIGEIDKVTKKITGTLSRSISDSCQAVIAPSVKTKETLLKYGVKTPIYVIPTGLNLKQFNPMNRADAKVAEIRKAYGIKEEDHVVAYVGRVAQEKSIDIAIKGFQYVKNPNTKLMIVGGGPQLAQLKELSKSLNLDGKVIFTDKKTRDEVADYYFSADAFVSASLTETQGMTYIEALACALPVFARPDDVLKDLVIENETGYLFEEPKEFAEKVDLFFEKNPDEINIIKKNALDKVSIYDGDIFYAKVLSVYYQAMDDYADAYEITKIKTVDDGVKITAENDKEEQAIKVLISLDDYFEFKIRKGVKIDRSQMEEFLHKEQLLLANRLCIRKLQTKDRTRKEMIDILKTMEQLSETDIQDIIRALEFKGYINDYLYTKNKIENMQNSLQGRNKIIRSLMKKGIEREMIENCLTEYGNRDDETSIAIQMAEKLQNTIKDKSSKMKRQMIVNRLISNGFDSGTAQDALSHLDQVNSDEEQQHALEKTIAKALRNYSRKYQGRQLKTMVSRYCINKGFSNDEIREKLNEMEWEDEQDN